MKKNFWVGILVLVASVANGHSALALEGQKCKRAGEARATVQGVFGCLKNGRKGLKWRLIQPAMKTTTTSTTTTTIFVACALGGLCKVGDIGPGGGVVFYVHPNGGTFSSPGSDCGQTCRYLEAAPSPEGGDVQRSGESGNFDDRSSNVRTRIDGADRDEIGSGFQNSIDIAKRSGNTAANTAAVAALDLVSGGKSDWHLPSINELVELQRQKAIVGNFQQARQVGSRIYAAYYWSSTELEPVIFRTCSFSAVYECSNREGGSSKNAQNFVRPVRAF